MNVKIRSHIRKPFNHMIGFKLSDMCVYCKSLISVYNPAEFL